MDILTRRFKLLCLLTLSVVGLSPAAALAQTAPAPDDIDIEDLMKIEVQPVFGASLRLQPVTEAPASITIITAEDIVRNGYLTLADILSSVRGLYVTNDRNYNYIGARGFAVPGDYNSRILLLVDGYRFNDPIYQQAMPDRGLGLDVFAFERVEIIRGPASSLYGTSAFFAVVNIITKSGAAINGLAAAADAGSLGTQMGRLAAGRRWDNGVDAAVVAAIGEIDGNERLYYSHFDRPAINNGIVENADDEQFRNVFARVSFGHLRISGLVGEREKTVPTAAFGTAFNNPNFRTVDRRAYVTAQYERVFDGTSVSVQSHVSGARYDGVYPFKTDNDMEDSSVILQTDYSDGRWWGLEGRVSRAVTARHMLTLGADVRHHFLEEQGGGYEDIPTSAFLISNTATAASIYAQDEITLTNRLFVTAGLRYDTYAGFDRLTPRIAVIAKPSNDQAFKYLFGNAFRAPNAYELDYYSQPTRRDDLAPETITSHEVVWEQYAGTWLRTSASAYYNDISNLITLVGEDDLFSFENRGSVRARGLEFEAEARHRSGLRALSSYVLQETVDLDLDEELTNSPRYSASLEVSGYGPGRVLVALDTRYLSRRLTLAGDTVRPVVLTNLMVRVPIRSGLVVSAAVRNLFDWAYADPGSAEHRQRSLPQDGRTLRVRLEWSGGRR